MIKRHDDAAPARELSEAEVRLQRRLIDCETKLEHAEVELAGVVSDFPHLKRPTWLMGERLRNLSALLAGMRDARKGNLG